MFEKPGTARQQVPSGRRLPKMKVNRLRLRMPVYVADVTTPPKRWRTPSDH